MACPAYETRPRRNPVPSARVAVIDSRSADPEVLLVQMGFGDVEGAWVPPDGRVEAGESLPQAVTRERQQEPGLAADRDRTAGTVAAADDAAAVDYWTAEAIRMERSPEFLRFSGVEQV